VKFLKDFSKLSLANPNLKVQVSGDLWDTFAAEETRKMTCYAVIGGAGFIGSHFVDKLMETGHSVKVIDNLCSGSLSRIAKHAQARNFEFIEIDVEDTSRLVDALKGAETVVHLASNPDIARAAIEPRIDFTQGTVLTESVVEASRITGIAKILYASGSGVYGDKGNDVLFENSPLRPISTYGASKAAGELLLESYSYMFGIQSIAFRFANVVGARQTHGVGYDFINRLRKDKTSLHILGNGEQSKSYVHVSDIVKGVLLASEKVESRFDVFNISTPDYITVNEISDIALEELKIDKSQIHMTYSGGDRGWRADVPIVRINADKISKIGWTHSYNSREAIRESIREMISTSFS
jgi:UDP-glucose 4-epimerase